MVVTVSSRGGWETLGLRDSAGTRSCRAACGAGLDDAARSIRADYNQHSFRCRRLRAGTQYANRVDRDELVRVLRAFETERLEYVLIGATAMGFHGLVRATEDVDLMVRATAENLERLRKALRSAYANDPHIEDIRSDDLLGAYPAVRYYPPSGDLFFDLITRLGDAANFDTVDSEIKTIDDVAVKVATPASLYRLKKGTVRPLDHADAAALRERFNLKDE